MAAQLYLPAAARPKPTSSSPARSPSCVDSAELYVAWTAAEGTATPAVRAAVLREPQRPRRHAA